MRNKHSKFRAKGSYKSGGYVSVGRNVRPYKHKLFTCWTIPVILVFSIGIIVVAMQSGIIK